MVMTLQPLFPFLLLTKIATVAASAAISKNVRLSAVKLRVGPVEPPVGPVKLPVSPFNPATTLFAKSAKKPTALLAPPEPIWSPNAKESISATTVSSMS